MNLIGYSDVVQHAMLLQLPGDVVAPVASIPGFVLLKLFAWADRWSTTRRDVSDVAYVMREYQRIPSVVDRLYEERAVMLEAAAYDLDAAVIMLLGEDVSSIASPETAQALALLLANEKVRRRLGAHMQAADALGAYRVDPEMALEWFARGLTNPDGMPPDS